MMEEEELSEFYNKTLYGPHKDKSQERYKSFCTTDSVKDALQSGEYDAAPESKWTSSMKECHKVWFTPPKWQILNIETCIQVL